MNVDWNVGHSLSAGVPHTRSLVLNSCSFGKYKVKLGLKEPATVNVAGAVQDMQKSIDEQTKVIQSLVEQIQKQQEYINNKLEEKDRRLMAGIKENEESIKQVAVTNHEEEKKGWLARLFGK
ncbi:hypothetical protein ABES08_04930 [Peribacillus simplex]|uniref:hypothetical protein n=1 Tax=Peribacillus simplex TaxID=1478 RepID=UPI003D29B65C